MMNEQQLAKLWIGVWTDCDRVVYCDECDGGIVERIIGEDRSGMGGISPVTRDERCEECEEGLVTCEDCGATPSYKVGGEVLCEDCINDMDD